MTSPNKKSKFTKKFFLIFFIKNIYGSQRLSWKDSHWVLYIQSVVVFVLESRLIYCDNHTFHPWLHLRATGQSRSKKSYKHVYPFGDIIIAFCLEWFLFQIMSWSQFMVPGFCDDNLAASTWWPIWNRINRFLQHSVEGFPAFALIYPINIYIKYSSQTPPLPLWRQIRDFLR